MHCSNWANMLELPSDMRRYFIVLSVLVTHTMKMQFFSTAGFFLLWLTSVLIPGRQVH